MILSGIVMIALCLLLVWNNIRKNKAAEESGFSVVEIAGYGYIEYLSLPTLGMELLAMETWDEARLKIAVCLYYGSVSTTVRRRRKTL